MKEYKDKIVMNLRFDLERKIYQMIFIIPNIILGDNCKNFIKEPYNVLVF